MQNRYIGYQTEIDSNGAVASSVVEVDSFPAPDSITLRSNVQSGVAPLEITLEIDSTFGSFPESTLFSDGPDVPEVTPVSPEEYQVTMTTEGIYDFTAEVVDDQGITYTDTVTIVVLDFGELDALLKKKWEDMLLRLSESNLDAAMAFLSPDAQLKYRRVFEALGADLPQIIASLPPIEAIDIFENVAEYVKIRFQNGQDRLYIIEFNRDAQGFWKIVSF